MPFCRYDLVDPFFKLCTISNSTHIVEDFVDRIITIFVIKNKKQCSNADISSSIDTDELCTALINTDKKGEFDTIFTGEKEHLSVVNFKADMCAALNLNVVFINIFGAK